MRDWQKSLKRVHQRAMTGWLKRLTKQKCNYQTSMKKIFWSEPSGNTPVHWCHGQFVTWVQSRKNLRIFKARWELKSCSQSLPLLSSALCPKEEQNKEALMEDEFLCFLSTSCFQDCVQRVQEITACEGQTEECSSWKEECSGLALLSLSFPVLSSCNVAFWLVRDYLAKESRKSNASRGTVKELQQWSSAAADTSAVPGLAAAVLGGGGGRGGLRKQGRESTWEAEGGWGAEPASTAETHECVSLQSAKKWLSNRGTAEIEVREGGGRGEKREGERGGSW